MMNIINGGVHANNSLKIQEFMIRPDKARSFTEAIRMCFLVINELGQELANMIPKEVDDGYYFGTPGKSRKGNAHDWYYTETGCIQYLIEVGTENDRMIDEQGVLDTSFDHVYLLFSLFVMISQTYSSSVEIYLGRSPLNKSKS